MPPSNQTPTFADTANTDPNTLTILHYPHPALRTKALPLPPTPDDTVRAVAQRMIQLMIDAPGIGLAAPQVGLPWRMFVAHVPAPAPGSDDAAQLANDPNIQAILDAGVQLFTNEPTVYINPTITEYSRDLEPYEEGCLSLPHITGHVRRPSTCTINALDAHGNPFTHRATDLLARCWQHEQDHLDAVLITDKFSPLDRRRAKRELEHLEATFN